MTDTVLIFLALVIGIPATVGALAFAVAGNANGRGYQPTEPLKGCPPTPDGHYRDEQCRLHKGVKP